MSDQHYRLIVDMETRGSLAPHLEKIGTSAGGLGKVKDHIGGIASSLGGIAAGLGNVFTGAVEAVGGIAVGLAKVGAVAAGGALAYGVVGLNNELEQTRTSLAAIFNAQIGGGMDKNLGLAADTLKDMRKDAAMLPGEFKDLLGFMRLGSTPGLQAGASIPQLERLSANAMAAAAATGVDQAQASREFAQLLQGRAGAHNVFGTMLGISGEKAQSFNASSGSQKLATLEGELGKYAPAIEAFSTTFDALKSTMIDNAKSVLAKVTGGVFDHVKMAMGDANKWFDAHETQVTAFAEKVGDKLVYAFELGRIKIREWTPVLTTFAVNAYHEIQSIWTRIEPLVERVGDMMKRAFADPKTFEKLESILKLYAAVKVGGMAAPAAGGLMNLGSTIGGAAFGTEGLVAAMGGIGAVGIAAGAASIAIVGMGATLYGAFDVLTDTSNEYHEYAVKQMNEINESAARMSESTKGLGEVGKGAADLLGVGMLKFTNDVTSLIEPLVTMTMEFGVAIGGAIVGLGRWAHLLDEAAPRPDGVTKVGTFDGISRDLLRAEREDRGTSQKKGVPGGGGTNIQKVEIVVTSNQDPDRIARLTVDKLRALARNPTSSSYAPKPLGGK